MAGVKYNNRGVKGRHEKEENTSDIEYEVYLNADKELKTKGKLNYGYDDDEKYVERKDINGNNFANRRKKSVNGNENTQTKGTPPPLPDKSMGSKATDHVPVVKNGGYYGDMTYFVDDEEETKTLTVAGDNNWTFGDPNHSLTLTVGTKYKSENGSHDSEEILSYSNSKNANDEHSINYEHRSKISHIVEEGIATENNSGVNAYRFNHNFEEVERDYDDVAVVDTSGVDDVKIQDDDIKDVLEGFDYLDDIVDVNDDVKEVLSGFDYLDELNDNQDDGINDALGKFDYLDDLDEQGNAKPSTVAKKISNYESNSSERHGQIMNNQDHTGRASVKNAQEDMPRRKLEAIPNHQPDLSLNTTYLNKRIFDEDTLEFRNHNVHNFEAAFENKCDISTQNHVYKNEYQAHRQKTHDVKKSEPKMLPEIHRSKNYDKFDDRFVGLVDRTRSEEIVSSFTAGEFILRRTRSEDIQHPKAGRNKLRAELETLPEDRRSSCTDSGSLEYKENRSPGSGCHCGVCGFILKVVLVLLFGLAATKITLGVVFRNSCQTDEIVPICVIASGAVSFCYCVVFLSIHLYRKRTKNRISRIFRAILVFIWVLFLGLIIAGCVLLYPSVQEHAFSDCGVQEDCCDRKLSLLAFGAIITDVICLFCFVIVLCCAK